MRLKLPPKVSYILDILQRHGFEAYAVGGCVRDLILAREPDDFDITTQARPEEVKACFRRTVDTGIKHGTVTVMLGSDAFEVTTYRIDGTYSDGRHPDSVLFTPNLADDLARRDFTINAMAYNETAGLVDLFGGMRDLQKKRIRCVGDPVKRFEEDALRVMRAVRFAAQLGFQIDRDTEEAVKQHAGHLRAVSAERIRTELMKLLLSPNPEMAGRLADLGIAEVVLPELERLTETPLITPHGYENDTVWLHTIRSLRYVEADAVLRLVMLLHEAGRPDVRYRDDFGWDHFPGYASLGSKIADQVLRRLKFDNKTRNSVVNLIRCQELDPATDASSVRLCMHETGPENFGDYLAVRYADAAAGRKQAFDENDPEYVLIENLMRRAEQIRRNRDPLTLKELAVNGTDLAAIGISGKETGEVLGMLLREVLANPEINKKEQLLVRAGRAKKGEGT